MPLPKPNHKCAYCGKEYYACNYCDRTDYRRFACSQECFAKVAWKFGAKYAHLRPQRTDMTEEQIDDLMEKPIEQVKAESLEELKDYREEIEQIGFNGVVSMINKELDEQ